MRPPRLCLIIGKPPCAGSRPLGAAAHRRAALSHWKCAHHIGAPLARRHGDLVAIGAQLRSLADVAGIKHCHSKHRSPSRGPTMRGSVTKSRNGSFVRVPDVWQKFEPVIRSDAGSRFLGCRAFHRPCERLGESEGLERARMVSGCLWRKRRCLAIWTARPGREDGVYSSFNGTPYSSSL